MRNLMDDHSCEEKVLPCADLSQEEKVTSCRDLSHEEVTPSHEEEKI